MFSPKQRGVAWSGLTFGTLWAALAGLPSATLTLDEAAGQPLDALYGGQQIRVVIASGARGGHDAHAPILALHLDRPISGKPRIIQPHTSRAAGHQPTERD